MKQSIGWHKDKWLDIENIYISANDRGLKFGDGIFETVLIKKNNAVDMARIWIGAKVCAIAKLGPR